MNVTFCILACAKSEKYSKRLKDYLDYGFKYNNKENKVNFVFLVEDEPKPSFIPDEYLWYNCPTLPLSCRFLKYLKESNDDSDWIVQVDDDSSTDLDKTCELLSQYYNHEDSMMLMGGRNTDLEFGLQNVVRMMNIKNFFFNAKDISKFDTHPYFVHAWEPTIISKKAYKNIKDWTRLGEYFELCLKVRPTFGDQVPYLAAKLAKIPIVECSFMSPFNKNSDYSAINLNGRYSHIHYVKEEWSGYKEFIQKMKQVKEGTFVYEEQKNDNLWKLYGGPKGNERFYGVINLNKDGTTNLYSHDNESFWEKTEDSITFFNGKKQKTCILKKKNENEYEGPFLSKPEINHLIIRTQE